MVDVKEVLRANGAEVAAKWIHPEGVRVDRVLCRHDGG